MSRAPAPSRRSSTNRCGWLVHQPCADTPLASLGSGADPTGFHLDTAHHAWQNDTCSSGLATLSCGDSYAQSSGQGPGVGVRDVFSRGMTGVQEWPPGLAHRRPFFDEHPRQGVYLYLPIPVPQMRSSLPRYVPTSAHDSWQVLMCEGQSCSHFRAFTNDCICTLHPLNRELKGNAAWEAAVVSAFCLLPTCEVLDQQGWGHQPGVHRAAPWL